MLFGGDTVGKSDINVTLSDLRVALSHNEFIYHYLPKVSLVSGTIVGAEALLRWPRDNGIIVPPGAFIPLAESAGLITEITIQMLNTLAKDLEAICALRSNLIVSFNVSARDFENEKFFLALFALIDSGKLKPLNIEVEVTESSVLSPSAALSHHLAGLHERGIKLALDDFGTGYANYVALSQFPFTSIKLDVGVIRRMSASYKDEAIVRSSIQMAHFLGLDVVAEGIESEYTYSTVQRLGCLYGQGYWIGRPMPIEDLCRLIRFGRRWPTGLVGMVYIAIIEHIEWRKRVIDAILLMDQQRAPLSESEINRLALPASESRLGRWYEDSIHQLEGIAVYRELGQAHYAVHDCATRCVNEALAGAPLTKLLRQLQELSKISTTLVGKLEELEIFLLRQEEDARVAGAKGNASI